MASSRALRKSSRVPSPMNAATNDVQLPEDETSGVDAAKADSWEEPPLRAPAPSYHDHKGLEKQGVLEHMAPLGSLPNQKVKLRLKAQDASRRNAPVRNGEASTSKEDSDVPDPAAPSMARRSEPRKLDDRASKSALSREKDDDQDYVPKGLTKTTPVKANPSQPLIPGTPSSRTVAGQARLREVVESAVERSNELGNPILGLAVKRLFDQSLHDRMLADLLDAVLSQKPTARQAAEFQGYIKIAKKQIKAEVRSRRHSSHNSKSVSMSPSKSTRPSVVRQMGVPKDLSDMTQLQNLESLDHSSAQHQPLAQQPQRQAKKMEGKRSLPRDERPAKRRRVSRSASTSSSLSSLPSTEDREILPTLDPNAQGSRSQTISTAQPSNPNKRPAPSETIGLDDSSDGMTAKRQRFSKTFGDFFVNESGVRGIRRSKKQTRLPSFAAGFAAGQGSKRDENDNLQSPGSSAQGELLIPPPAGARSFSRGVTPSQLGRPAKQVGKAARVKMSPMKGKTGVIAGIARPVRGAREDSEERENVPKENSDICFTCSGNGQLLCCDGCTRSFHFTCVDPPITDVPGETWYCVECKTKQQPQAPRRGGAFSSLVQGMEIRNPHAFSLPYEVRDFFKGVKTGDEGEFEEMVAMKTRTRAGYEEVPNNCKLKDAKDNTILCFHCRKSSLGNREMITCDYCNSTWHLDCLDPPLANPPRRTTIGRAKSLWKCPAHVDIESQALSSLAGQKRKANTNANERYIKPREPKRLRIVEPAISRGFINDGNIRVINSSSPEADQSSGTIYAIPEKAIKLDFIAQVKRREWKGEPCYTREQREAKALAARRRAEDQAREERREEMRIEARREAATMRNVMGGRPEIDREAALSLLQFARQSEVGVDDCMENLITTLIGEAPPEVIDLIAPPVPAVSKWEKELNYLEAMEFLIKTRRELVENFMKSEKEELEREQDSGEKEPESEQEPEEEAEREPSPPANENGDD